MDDYTGLAHLRRRCASHSFGGAVDRLTVLLALALATACTPAAEVEEVRPETIGVIVERESLGSTRFRLSLDNGEVVEFDANETPPLGSSPFPEEGMLLFLGEEQAWYTTAEPHGDCYEMSGSAGDRDGKAMLSTGLVLEVAPAASGQIAAGGPSEWVHICVDAQGRYVGDCDAVDGGCSPHTP
jgi:hypothetical protein